MVSCQNLRLATLRHATPSRSQLCSSRPLQVKSCIRWLGYPGQGIRRMDSFECSASIGASISLDQWKYAAAAHREGVMSSAKRNDQLTGFGAFAFGDWPRGFIYMIRLNAVLYLHRAAFAKLSRMTWRCKIKEFIQNGIIPI